MIKCNRCGEVYEESCISIVIFTRNLTYENITEKCLARDICEKCIEEIENFIKRSLT